MSEVIEDLMKPRYKVIAHYPQSQFIVGVSYTKDSCCEILNPKNVVGCMSVFNPLLYPAIFKLLEWWEDRKHFELPKYINWKHGGIFEVLNWRSNHNTGELQGAYVNEPNAFIFITDFIPATETEYLGYINSKP